MAKRGELDAGPISLVDAFELEKDFEPLSNLGIAVENFAGSVLLFSKRSIHHLGPYRIGLIPDSVTSSELLKLILREVYGIRPLFQDGFGPEDTARLLIGDEALQKTLDPKFRKKFPHIYDLGEEWRKWKDLPFVFARWMVKKNVDPEWRTALSNLLIKNIQDASKNPAQAALWHSRIRGWRTSYPERYLKRFRYRLGPEEEKSILEFRNLTAQPAVLPV